VGEPRKPAAWPEWGDLVDRDLARRYRVAFGLVRGRDLVTGNPYVDVLRMGVRTIYGERLIARTADPRLWDV
jgi:hypothetical protein